MWDAYLTAVLADARLSECHDVREFLNAKRGAYEPETAGGGLGAGLYTRPLLSST